MMIYRIRTAIANLLEYCNGPLRTENLYMMCSINPVMSILMIQNMMSTNLKQTQNKIQNDNDDMINMHCDNNNVKGAITKKRSMDLYAANPFPKKARLTIKKTYKGTSFDAEDLMVKIWRGGQIEYADFNDFDYPPVVLDQISVADINDGVLDITVGMPQMIENYPVSCPYDIWYKGVMFQAQMWKDMTDEDFEKAYAEFFEDDVYHTCDIPTYSGSNENKLFMTTKHKKKHNRYNHGKDILKYFEKAFNGQWHFVPSRFSVQAMENFDKRYSSIACKRTMWMNCMIRWQFDYREFAQDIYADRIVQYIGKHWDLCGDNKGVYVYFCCVKAHNNHVHLRVNIPDVFRCEKFATEQEVACAHAVSLYGATKKYAQEKFTAQMEADTTNAQSKKSKGKKKNKKKSFDLAAEIAEQENESKEKEKEPLEQQDHMPENEKDANGREVETTPVKNDIVFEEYNEEIDYVGILELVKEDEIDQVAPKRIAADPDDKDPNEGIDKDKDKPWWERIAGSFFGVYERAKKSLSNIYAASDNLNYIVDKLKAPFQMMENFGAIFDNAWERLKHLLNDSFNAFDLFLATVTLALITLAGLMIVKVARSAVEWLTNMWCQMFGGLEWSKCLEYIRTKYACVTERFTAQVAEDDDGEAEEFDNKTLFCPLVFLGHWCFKVPWKFFTIHFDDFLKACKNVTIVGTAMTKVKDMLNILTGAFNWFLDCIHLYWKGVPRGVTDEMMSKLLLHVASKVQDNAACTVNELQYYKSLLGYYKSKMHDCQNTHLLAFVSKLVTNLENVIGQKESKNFVTRRGRVPTYTILFKGDTNVGKTSTAVALANGLAAMVVGDVHDGAVFSKDSTNPWWDGIRDAVVVMIDDIGTERDFTGNKESEWTQVIKLKNPAMYPVPIADANQKGTQYYNALFTIFTTNLPTFRGFVQSINTEAALDRRFDFVLSVSEMESYTIERINGKEIEKKPRSLEQLIPIILQAYAGYYTKEVNVSEMLNKRVNQIIHDCKFPENYLDGEAAHCFAAMQALRKKDRMCPQLADAQKALMILFPSINDGVTYIHNYNDGASALGAVWTEDTMYKLPEKYFKIARALDEDEARKEAVLAALIEDYHGNISTADFYRSEEREKTREKMRADIIKASKSNDKKLLKLLENVKTVKIENVPVDSREQAYGISAEVAVRIDEEDRLPETRPTIIGYVEELDYDPKATALERIWYNISGCFVRGHSCFVTGDESSNKHLSKRFVPTEETKARAFCWFCHIEDQQLSLDNVLQLCTSDYIKALLENEEYYKYDSENNKWYFKFASQEDMYKIHDDISLNCRNVYKKTINPLAYYKAKAREMYARNMKKLAKIITPEEKRGILMTTISAVTIYASLLTVFGVAVGIVMLFNRPKKKNIEMTAQTSNGIKYVAAKKSSVHKPVIMTGQVSNDIKHDDMHMYAQMAMDPQGVNDQKLQDMLPRILNQMCYVVNDTKKRNIHIGFFLNSNTLLLTKHCKLALPSKDDELRFIFPEKGITFEGIKVKLGECEVRVITNDKKEVDGMIVRFPPKKFIPGMKNVVSKFSKMSDIAKHSGSNYVLATLDHINGMYIPHLHSLSNVTIINENKEYSITYDGREHVFVTPRYLYYRFPGHPGACVSLLMCVDPRNESSGRIDGIHIAAGDIGMSMGIIISREMIESTLKEFKMEEVVYQGQVDGAYFGSFKTSVNQEETTYEAKKYVDLAFNNGHDHSYCPDKTKIVQSAIGKAGVIPMKKKPVHLKTFINANGEKVNPFVKAQKKYEHPVYTVDSTILEISKNDYLNVQRSIPNVHEPRILTLDEAVFGSQDLWLKAIDSSTSSGYRYKRKFPGAKGKKHLFDQSKNFIHTFLSDRVALRIECAKRGIILEHVVEDLGKDEKKEIEKVDLGKMRLFNTNELDLTVSLRMYFGAFVCNAMACRIYNESAVGINPTSDEWHILAQYLSRQGDAFIAGDFSNYDGTLCRDILMAYLDIIQDWYHDSAENQRIRRILWYTVVAPLHIYNGYFYWNYCANPSGNALTVFINTGYAQLFFRYIWYRSLKEHGLRMSQFAFSDFVALQVYGDDNIMGVHPNFRHILNPVKINLFAEEIGMSYTDEAKRGDVTFFRSLKDCSFLKRAFYYDEDRCKYIGRLDFDTLIEIPCWTWIDINKNEWSMSVEQTIRELALYDRETFEYWKKIILDTARACNYPKINASSYDAYHLEGSDGSDLLPYTDLVF